MIEKVTDIQEQEMRAVAIHENPGAWRPALPARRPFVAENSSGVFAASCQRSSGFRQEATMPARVAPSSRARSTDPRDYQRVARPFAAMAKSFADGFEIEPHSHPRDQLIYAVSGLMRVRTERDAWIVPPDRAVYLPARTIHSISMRGDVELRTLYIARH